MMVSQSFRDSLCQVLIGSDTEVTDEGINPFAKPVKAVDGETSPATSTTVEDDDDREEEYYEGDEIGEEANEEQANPLGSVKRRAEDVDEASASVKRTRFPAQGESQFGSCVWDFR